MRSGESDEAASALAQCGTGQRAGWRHRLPSKRAGGVGELASAMQAAAGACYHDRDSH